MFGNLAICQEQHLIRGFAGKADVVGDEQNADAALLEHGERVQVVAA